MSSTRGEAVDAIDRILAENDLIVGVALNVLAGAGRGAIAGVMGAGDPMAALIAEGTGLDTVMVAPTEGSTGEENAIEAARAAMGAFLSLPGNIDAMTARALRDITMGRGTEEGR